jgi:predicted dehydrogenase
MNILILGLGSIGQRHLRNLRSVNKQFKFFSLRRKYITPLLDANNNSKKGNIEKTYKIKNFNNFKDIKNIDAAFICTPSKFHVIEAIKLLKKNINIFVEKPIGSSLKNINQLKNIIIKKPKLKSMMGFQLKFNPIILNLKKLILKKTIGKIYNIFVHHGEHIDDFHPYENYIKSYAARKELGGGVILTQIHELDYLSFLFDGFKIKIKKSFPSKISNLKINVEDNVTANLEVVKKNYKIKCLLHLNYYERPKKRLISLIGEKGKIECDLNSGKINIFKNKKIKSMLFKFDRNQIFINQVKYFINCIKKNKKIKKEYDLINGMQSLKLALKLK